MLESLPRGNGIVAKAFDCNPPVLAHVSYCWANPPWHWFHRLSRNFHAIFALQQAWALLVLIAPFEMYPTEESSARVLM